MREIIPEVPKPPFVLTKDEKKIWEYVTASLYEYGFIHKTDGLLVSVIVKTFINWLKAEKKVEDIEKETGSIYVKTPNGFEQPHQAVYEARKLKKELLDFLPEAVLTIASFSKIALNLALPNEVKNTTDPLEDYREKKRRMSMRGINGGKK